MNKQMPIGRRAAYDGRVFCFSTELEGDDASRIFMVPKTL